MSPASIPVLAVAHVAFTACARPSTGGRFSFSRGRLVGYKVGVIGGDGIGPDVVAEALKAVRAAGVDLDLVDYDLGGARYLRTGEILPDAVLDELRGLDAILLGAVGDPRDPARRHRAGPAPAPAVRPRPVRQPPPLRPRLRSQSIVVVRENTEGPYTGEGGFLRKGTPAEVATQGSVNTRMGVERCVRFAFNLAAGRPRRHLTLVHKTNVLTYAGDLWQRTFDEVAAEYPEVTTAYCHVDAACIYLVESPDRFDVDRHRQPVRRHPHRPGGAPSPAGSAWPRRPTSTPTAPAPRCSSRSTARRPTSWAPAGPIPWPPSGRRP